MIISFSDDVQRFKTTGEKSYNLANILNLNVKVPHYVCITNNDCENNTIKKEVLKRLLKVLENHFGSETLYAVRFSLSLQGIEDNLLSGQFPTFLNVPTQDLEKCINDCIASLSSRRISSYIKRHNITQSIDINVMVQEMIHQDFYGVMYTYNPLGILSERVISIGKDECNDIANQKQSYNTYYYNMDNNIYLVQNDNTINLTFQQIGYLNQLCDRLKTIFKSDLRIDFCISNSNIYMLQVDTIPIDIKNIITLHKTNIELNCQDITYPLITSFIKQCYSSVFSDLILQLTNSSEVVKNNQDTISNILCNYNGRLFYNINNLYKMFSLIPFSNKITPLLEKELNLNSSNNHKENYVENTSKLSYIFNMFKVMTSISKKVKVVNTKFSEIEKIFNDCYCEELSDIQLRSLYKIIFTRSIAKWDTNIINSIYCYFNSYILKKFFKKDIDISSLDINSNMNLEKGLAGTFQQRIIDSISDQEYSKEDNDRLFSYIQKIFLHMGLNLVNLGYLSNENDVYYLTIHELFNENMHSYKDLVSQRKNLYDFYQKLPNYKLVTFYDKVSSKNINKSGYVIIL